MSFIPAWLAGAVVSLLLLLSSAAQAQSADAATKAALNAPQALPDIWIGRADAPVTIIEYAPLNCGHCATFEQTVLPELKAKYIDTAKCASSCATIRSAIARLTPQSSRAVQGPGAVR